LKEKNNLDFKIDQELKFTEKPNEQKLKEILVG